MEPDPYLDDDPVRPGVVTETRLARERRRERGLDDASKTAESSSPVASTSDPRSPLISSRSTRRTSAMRPE